MKDVAGVAAPLPFGWVWPKLKVVGELKPFCGGCALNAEPKLVAVPPFCVFPKPPKLGVPFDCSGAAGVPKPFVCGGAA